MAQKAEFMNPKPGARCCRHVGTPKNSSESAPTELASRSCMWRALGLPLAAAVDSGIAWKARYRLKELSKALKSIEKDKKRLLGGVAGQLERVPRAFGLPSVLPGP